MKASRSRSAFFSISTGHGVPPCCLKKSHCVLSWTTAGMMTSHGGHEAVLVDAPTMISSSGSHSLVALTTGVDTLWVHRSSLRRALVSRRAWIAAASRPRATEPAASRR